jgi:phage-related protein
MAVFNPVIPPQEEPSGDVRFNTTSVKFGEGYEQNAGNGLNPKIQNWPLTWVGSDAEINSIIDFFDAHEGWMSFQWLPPKGPMARFVVKRYTHIPAAAGNAKLNATLEQVFYP